MRHQIGFWPTSRLKQSWEVLWHSTSGVPTGKRSQAASPLCGWDLKNCSSVLLIIPGHKLTSSSICEQIAGLVSCSCCFVLSSKTWMLLSLGLGWSEPLPRAEQTQDLSPNLFMVPQALHSQQGVKALTVRVCPDRLEGRSEECTTFSWSLNKTIYLISLTSWWLYACKYRRHGFDPSQVWNQLYKHSSTGKAPCVSYSEQVTWRKDKFELPMPIMKPYMWESTRLWSQ